MSKLILLADDDADDRQLFAEVLEEVCTETRLEHALNGSDALDKLYRQLPDVVILDINMPKLNGLDCLSAIRRDHKLKNLPVIIMTTSSDPMMVQETYNLGATHYLVKPSSYSVLKEIIVRILNSEFSSPKTLWESFLLSNSK